MSKNNSKDINSKVNTINSKPSKDFGKIDDKPPLTGSRDKRGQTPSAPPVMVQPDKAEPSKPNTKPEPPQNDETSKDK